MFQNQIELLMAAAINRASGVYLVPRFAPTFHTTYTYGYYQSRHGTVSAGYMTSEQSWSGNTGVIMRGDPLITGYGRNDLSGGSGNDVIFASTGNFSMIWGGAGNDSIFGGLGSVDAMGGEGDDFIVAGVGLSSPASGNYLVQWQNSLANANSMTAEQLHSHFTYSNSNNGLYGGAGNDTLIAPGDGNNLMYGDNAELGAGNDLLFVGNGNNTLYGGGGNDLIITGNGNNYIEGGSGDDSIFAGSGNDTILGGEGDDYICDFGGENSISGGAGNDIIEVQGASSSIYGDDGNDYIYVYGEQNVIDGGHGDDIITVDGDNNIITGGDGNDIIRVTSDNNTINGGDGFDLISYDRKDTGITIDLTLLDSYTNFEGLIGTSHADQIIGTAESDYLDGGSGADTLIGGAGNDTLIGGMGNDHLTGGTGQDVFVFIGTDLGTDTVTDFNAAEGDLLAIQTQNGTISLEYINNTNLGVGSFADSNVLVFKDGSNTYVYADMNGDGNYTSNTDMTVTLSGVQDITADNIVFYSAS